jgi:Tfp pilus assembly protein PilF
VIHRSLQLGRVLLGLTACACLIIAGPGGHGTPSAQGSDDTGSSKSLGSSVKDGWDKFTGAILPAKKPAEPPEDAISLKTRAKAGPEVYTAVARLYEQSGKTAEAEKQYQLALKDEPDDLSALLGYAHLQEGLGKSEEAVKLYQQAAKAHPTDAAVFNNLGLCYAHRGMPDEAITALNRAVQLQPKNVLYRNNLATILVEKGQVEQAFSQLRVVHGDAVAYYNLGYLLNRKGKKAEAIHHFTMALKRDPSLSQARMWLAWLQDGTLPSATQPPPQVATQSPSQSPLQPPAQLVAQPSERSAEQPSAPSFVQPSPAVDRRDSPLRMASAPPQPSPIVNRPAEWPVAADSRPPLAPPTTKRPDPPVMSAALPTSPPAATTPRPWPAGAMAPTPPVGREPAPRGVAPQPSQSARPAEGSPSEVRLGASGGDLPPMPPELSSPKRLPPVASAAVAVEVAPLPEQPAETREARAAPAPTPILKSALRVLPREPQ